MCGVLKKSEQVKLELFTVFGGKEELKIEGKWPAKASVINCGSIIILLPTLIRITDCSFLLGLEIYCQK
jgi:hypothetical protein